MNTKHLENSLLQQYRDIMDGCNSTPEWAVHKRNFPNELVKCTIPFIGNYYECQKRRILVYASAENLSGYYPGNTKEWIGDWLDDDVQAINRHRKCFDDPSFQDDPFFPHVHLGPMNNGWLSTAIYYIAAKLCDIEPISPREFYETIAFGNYGKYSIETELQKNKRIGIDGSKFKKANEDYADQQSLLEASHAFIQADIVTLKPDYIILPSSVYNTDKKFIDQIKENATIIPIYQMNATVINGHIAPTKRASHYPPYDENKLPAAVKTWFNELQRKGITKEKYLSVFTYLDHVLENDIQ